MTEDNPSEILAKLSSKRLPVLPSGTSYLLESLTDESIDFPQLTAVLARFPTIVARLISLANSAWSSPVSEISSLEMACTRLGLGVVKSTSIVLAVAAPFDPSRCPPFDPQRYWSRALMVAEIASQLAMNSPNSNQSQTARAAGLLHNLGLLWIVDQLPELAQQAIQTYLNGTDISLDQTLTGLTGVGYSQAGEYLGTAWRLPAPLVTSMAHHSDPDYRETEWWMARLVGLAISMVSTAEQQKPWSAPPSTMENLQIDKATANRVFSTIAGQLEQTWELAGFLFAS